MRYKILVCDPPEDVECFCPVVSFSCECEYFSIIHIPGMNFIDLRYQFGTDTAMQKHELISTDSVIMVLEG